VTSAFIIQVHSQLQPDPNEETAALLRVLIHKIDNTTFGGDVPALPRWTGPPRTALQVQCILYASLTASLLSAFLAMLGKQWLNRYASIDMRGSAIERSQNRQRKLDGIVAWYFDHVLESLPLMLQGVLLLFGCALSRYLWEIDTTVASVVVGVTSFGVLFCLFIAVAGAASDSCPYQTSGASVIRHISGLVRSANTLFVERSEVHSTSVAYWNSIDKGTAKGIIANTLSYPFALLIAFVIDVFHLGRETFRILVGPACKARNWSFGTSPVPDQAFNNRASKLDFRCIAWMLRTSLDKVINVSTLEFLGTILPLSGFDSSTTSALVVDCFNILSSWSVTGDGVVTVSTRGSERLAGVSAMCFLRAFSRLSSTEPTSAVIRDTRQRYKRLLPPPKRCSFPSVDFQGLPCPIVMSTIHNLLVLDRLERQTIIWRCYNPSADELVQVSHALAQAAQSEYHRGGDKLEVPDWLVCFALHFLSQEPLPPTLIVRDCLTIIAIDLGCNVSDNNRAPDEKYVSPTAIASPLTLFQCAAGTTFQLDNSGV